MIISVFFVVVDPVKVVKIQLITTHWVAIKIRCRVVVDPVKVVKIQLITTYWKSTTKLSSCC